MNSQYPAPYPTAYPNEDPTQYPQYPQYPSDYPTAYGQPYLAGPDPILAGAYPYPDQQGYVAPVPPPPQDPHS